VRVVTFGTYQRDYPRNAIVRSCLRRAGVTVDERHIPVWDGRRDAWSAGVGSLARLAAAELRLASRRITGADAVVVGYPGHLDMPAARFAARDRPLVFDPLVSLFDTLVSDRRRFDARSLAGRALLAADRRAFGRADLVVADTDAQAAFYADGLGVPAERLCVCRVGAEERLFTPRSAPPAGFHALFVGKLIPLHGLETILAAARLAPEIAFRVVGSGQLDRALTDAPANVSRIAWVEYEKLPGELRAAGCALGIFGSSAKARRVIPNKAYQALACAVPLVTGDTPAVRELLTHGEDAVLVPPGDPAALAEALRHLAGDRAAAARIGAAGRATFERGAGESVLGACWRRELERLAG
jgi:glycosyltransferase involved in cell wall biosynthesis